MVLPSTLKYANPLEPILGLAAAPVIGVAALTPTEVFVRFAQDLGR